jgi:hypothetical protein
MESMTRPTDSNFFASHTDAALTSIVSRYTAQAAAMVTTAPELATEAIALANNAWAEQVRRSVR